MSKMILACNCVLYHVIACIYHGEGSTDQTENILFCEPKFGVILFKQAFTLYPPNIINRSRIPFLAQ